MQNHSETLPNVWIFAFRERITQLSLQLFVEWGIIIRWHFRIAALTLNTDSAHAQKLVWFFFLLVVWIIIIIKESKAQKPKIEQESFCSAQMLISGYWTWYIVTALKEPLWFIESIRSTETLISGSYLIKRNVLFRCAGIPSVCLPHSPNLPAAFCTPPAQLSSQGGTAPARPAGCGHTSGAAERTQPFRWSTGGSGAAAQKPARGDRLR